jgi:hypothetical protein
MAFFLVANSISYLCFSLEDMTRHQLQEFDTYFFPVIGGVSFFLDLCIVVRVSHMDKMFRTKELWKGYIGY